MAKVYITRDLKTYTNGRFEISLQGESIKDIVGNLLKEHKDLGNHIYTNDGKLKNYVNIYLNEKNINSLDNFDTKVYEDDKIILFQAS
ncbi:ubiquitin family protein [Aliarcobacter cryaerophilus]|uniref:MoaD/ThiS family protein n=1 Tax=Aliarcobacter cryaerophilus TaxID=28198 RepID=UPI0008260831|nr:MoaD/ThiS family protein [Aliarcobacter cryaerophilus]